MVSLSITTGAKKEIEGDFLIKFDWAELKETTPPSLYILNENTAFISMNKTARCLDIYRKKQEFSGGILNLNNLNCESGRIDIDAGSFINYQM